MKRIITIMLLCLTGVGWGQEVKKEKAGSTSRISFVMGIGSSVAFDKVYQMPVVSPLDNNVKMEAGQRGRVSATFSISYTPYVYRITDEQNPEGYFATRGISFVAFFNPLNLSKSSNLEESFSLNNFGLGIGYKSITGFGVYLVGEIASIKQPRQWFINEFQNGDKSYEINGQIQNAFSSSDESIFRNKLIPYVGIKAC